MPPWLWDPQVAPALRGSAQQSPAVGSTAILGHCSAGLGKKREGRLLFYSHPPSFCNGPIFFSSSDFSGTNWLLSGQRKTGGNPKRLGPKAEALWPALSPFLQNSYSSPAAFPWDSCNTPSALSPTSTALTCSHIDKSLSLTQATQATAYFLSHGGKAEKGSWLTQLLVKSSKCFVFKHSCLCGGEGKQQLTPSLQWDMRMERDCPGSPYNSVADVDGKKRGPSRSIPVESQRKLTAWQWQGGDTSWHSTGAKGGFLAGMHAWTALSRAEPAEVPPALLGFTHEGLGLVSEGLDLDSGSLMSGLSAWTGMQ